MGNQLRYLQHAFALAFVTFLIWFWPNVQSDVTRLRYPAFASALAQSRAVLLVHAGVFWNTDGASQFREAGAELCDAAHGTALPPVSAEALTYYPEGYDSHGINPPPPNVQPATMVVPLAWSDHAVIPCKQQTRTAYFLLTREPIQGDILTAAYRDGWGWQPATGSYIDPPVLSRASLATAIAEADKDDRYNGKEPDAHYDQDVMKRLP